MKHSHHCNKCMREYPCFISHTGQLLGYLVTAQCLDCHCKAMERTLAALEASNQRLRRFLTPRKKPRDLLELSDFNQLYLQGLEEMFPWNDPNRPEPEAEYDPNAHAEERHNEPQ